ncbi:MAG: 5-(carboxyamino)imidazole ribonucleotide mutase [Candidatus Omnitrophica bacterium CG07_land_8_20_14_0_80_42_15]|uniref:N5-carboxyaminoimidazole ribonucleotide mutase n=1 Tax=Candidatus Aquitaenariimonas noxiae TaxID=1974741 RepID=A0A2J0KUT3_9BACT|nr:MAG: 5-(carboxyamino)imidazole ribonucleotide mutase [Candidatus Omnitrophica bacterium CG07_land_8_20_14_0_80_42_15]
MRKNLVSVIMGSDSDLPVLKGTIETLKNFGVGCEVKVLSTHRTPDDVIKYIKGTPKKGIKLIIAAAGGAAHLGGVIASHTILPVIGIPIETESLEGLDSLLSTVQMPVGIPVATMAIGKAGAKNAAIFAVQILAIEDKTLAKKIVSFRGKLRESVLSKNKNLKTKI